MIVPFRGVNSSGQVIAEIKIYLLIIEYRLYKNVTSTAVVNLEVSHSSWACSLYNNH